MEKIQFVTGLLEIDDNSIRFKPYNSRFSDKTVIQRLNIADVEQYNFKQRRLDEIVYLFRSFLLCVVLIISSVILSVLGYDNFFTFMLTFFSGICLFFSVSIFIGMFLTLLGLNYNFILNNLFGINYTLIKVQNNNGNNDLIFSILTEEKHKLPDLLKYKKEEEKKIIYQDNVSNNSNIEQLIKLADLKEKGLISDSEFEIEKSKIINS